MNSIARGILKYYCDGTPLMATEKFCLLTRKFLTLKNLLTTRMIVHFQGLFKKLKISKHANIDSSSGFPICLVWHNICRLIKALS